MGDAPQKKVPEEGLLIVNSTQVPNVMLDVLMPVVAPALWKIICCVARQTYGWQKKWDAISLTQAVEKTGLSKRCVIDGFADLAKAGVLLLGEVGRYGQEYRLNTSCDMDKACEFLTPKERQPRRKTGGVPRKEEANGGSEQSSMGGEPSSLAGVNPDHRPDSEPRSPELVNQVPVGGEPRSPEVVNPDHPQNKLSKDTNQKKLSKGEERPQISPSVLMIAQQRFMERLGLDWPSALARMQTDNKRRELFVFVRGCSKHCGFLDYSHAMHYLSDHDGWKDWPDLKDLDSQQEIEFPDPVKTERWDEAAYVTEQRGDIGVAGQQLFSSFREFMRAQLGDGEYRRLVQPLQFCCLTEKELHVLSPQAMNGSEAKLREKIIAWLPERLTGIKFVVAERRKVGA